MSINPKIIIESHLRKVCEDRDLSVVTEYKFHATRKWRFDWAVVPARVAVEYDGGIFTGGRHVNPHGYTRDAEKLNAANLDGWRVYRVTPLMFKPKVIGATLDMLEEAVVLGIAEARRKRA